MFILSVSSSASPSSSVIQKSINNFGYGCHLQCKNPNEGCYQRYDFDDYARRNIYTSVCSDTDPCLHGLKTCPPNQHCVTQAIYDFPPFGECFPNGGGPSDPCYNVDCGDGYDCVASPDSDDGYECYYSKYCIEAGCDRWYDICQLSYDNQGNEHAKCVPYRWSHTNKGGK